MLDDSYGFVGVCTYQRTTNGIEIRASYGEIWMRVDGRNGQPQSWMIPMASIPWGLPYQRGGIEIRSSYGEIWKWGRRTKRTTSKLDDSYGFHTVGVCTYHGEAQRATNGIEIRASYGEIWK